MPAKRGTTSELGGRNLRASRLLAGGVVARGGALERVDVVRAETGFASRFFLAEGLRNGSCL
jgi:hypothetical protein